MRINHSASCVRPEDLEALRPAFEQNFVGAGLIAEKVEMRLARLYEYSAGRLMNSGSNALLVALRILRRRHSGCDEVLVSGYVCTAVVNVILMAGLTPVFVDVNADDLNFDAEDLARRVGPQTLVVILTNLGGRPDRLPDGINLPVILDACQSIGARVNGALTYHNPAFVIFSFGPTKPLTGGTGGALLTDDNELAEEMQFETRGERPPEEYLARGYRPTYTYEVSAMDGLLVDRQLDQLDSFLARRRTIAAAYDAVIEEAGMRTVPCAPDTDPSYYRYYLLTTDSERVVAELQAAGVDARRSIAHNFARYRIGNAGELPRLREVPDRLVSLPIYPILQDSHITYITQHLRRALHEGTRL